MKSAALAPRQPLFVYLAMIVILFACPTSFAQFGEDWVIFVDPDTDEECGVVNTAFLELTILDRTGEVVIVTGRDTLLEDLLVDVDNEVFFNGFSSGRIVFADDADGFATAFWVNDLGTVVEVDERTGQPSDSRLFPEEIGDTGCDACDFVDDRSLCDEFVGGGGGGSGSVCGLGMVPMLLPVLLLLTTAKMARRG